MHRKLSQLQGRKAGLERRLQFVQWEIDQLDVEIKEVEEEIEKDEQDVKVKM